MAQKHPNIRVKHGGDPIPTLIQLKEKELKGFYKEHRRSDPTSEKLRSNLVGTLAHLRQAEFISRHQRKYENKPRISRLPRAGVRDSLRPSQINKMWRGSKWERQRELERQKKSEFEQKELKIKRLKKLLKWLLIIGISTFLLFILIDADIQLINVKKY